MVTATPASLTDVHATVLDAAGVDEAPPAGSTSLFALAEGAAPDRAVVSEYHASGSREAAFLLRQGATKYVRYASYPPQLFDLEGDPEELVDLATDPSQAMRIAALEVQLREALGGDPADIDASVKARQAGILAAGGGRDVVMARGDLAYSPPPGVRPAFT
jgi:choline-sulfatase